MPDRLRPKLVTVFQEGYSLSRLGRDMGAGVIVGIVALPLAIAFAIASGVGPERGLYTAIIAGFIISLLGGSRVQIGGPTGAFIVLVFAVVQKHGYDGLAAATLLAGVLLVLMGVARLGRVIQFVPYPVTVGFTSGIALIIAMSQVRDLLGLDIATLPAEFLPRLRILAENLPGWNPWAISLGVISIVITASWRRVFPAIPGSLVAILGITVLSAVVADGMIGGRHRPNMELIAQGVANIASPIFGGIPATGAIARTATNVKNGGSSPIAGMTHALVVLLIMLFFARWATLIPMSVLAGILLVVAFNMSEWRVFVRLFRSPVSDVIVLLITFLLTVVVDLTVALQTGMVLAAFLFMRRIAALSGAGLLAEPADDAEESERSIRHPSSRDIPDGVVVFRLNGALFFGAASKFQDAVRQIEKPVAVFILRMREVIAIDATGMRALEDLMSKLRRSGTTLVVSGLQEQPRNALERAGLLAAIGDTNLCANLEAALDRADQVLAERHPRPS